MNPMTKTMIIAALSLATLLNVGFAWQAFGDVTTLFWIRQLHGFDVRRRGSNE